jgi:hypothetical protein
VIVCIRCGWKTTDSARATLTTNMKAHLAKYNQKEDGESDIIRQPSITSMFQSKTEQDVRELLERNLLRWFVADDIPLGSPAFQ